MILHEVEVLSRERLGAHRLLRYRWEGEPPGPGQFVMARPEGPAATFDPLLNRPFFVHDYRDGVLSLLFEVRGRGTALLAREGAALRVSGPLGRGFTSPPAGPAVLVGGGVWVAPLKFLARRLEAEGVAYEIFLEAPDEAPEGYVAGIRRIFPEAEIVRTGPGDSPGTLLGAAGDLSRCGAVYASGPPGTLRAVREAAGERVPAQLALRERMACGSGACHGCAVPVRRNGEVAYARACVEGPVFPARELAW